MCAVAPEAVDRLRAADIAAGDADQQARIEAVIDAEGGAAQRVAEVGGVAVAVDAAGAADAGQPGGEARRRDGVGVGVAGGLARPGQRHARGRAEARAAPARHLAADRIHEQLARLHVDRAEIGIGLAAQRIECRRTLRRLQVGHCRDQAAVIAAGGDGVERAADGPLVVGPAGRAEGVGRQRQGEVDAVQIGIERGLRHQEPDAAGQFADPDVAAGLRRDDRVGRAGCVGAGVRDDQQRAGMDPHRVAGADHADAVAVALGIDLDLVGAAVEGEVAVDRQVADRVAGADRAAIVGDVAGDVAAAVERAALVDRDVAGQVTVDGKGAGIDGRCRRRRCWCR